MENHFQELKDAARRLAEQGDPAAALEKLKQANRVRAQIHAHNYRHLLKSYQAKMREEGRLLERELSEHLRVEMRREFELVYRQHINGALSHLFENEFLKHVVERLRAILKHKRNRAGLLSKLLQEIRSHRLHNFSEMFYALPLPSDVPQNPVLAHEVEAQLSLSELRVRVLQIQGHDKKTIATILSLSPRTIEQHCCAIRRKFELHKAPAKGVVVSHLQFYQTQP